ncbi:MAG: hypothetical protein RIB59_04520 [Rhodospirillales bacterium]
MCTRAVGALAHYLEKEGIATTHISLIRNHTERIKPPRALWVPFILGRPLGAPNDPAFQRKVLSAALALLEADAGPLIADFPEDAPDGIETEDDMTGMVCPVDLPPLPGEADEDGLAAAFLEEVDRLRPWYALSVERRGRTTVGVSGVGIDEAAGYILKFIDDPATPPLRGDLKTDAFLRAAYEDIKAYYSESMMAQPGAVSQRQIENWFWGETAFAKVVFALRAVCLASETPAVKVLGEKSLVPAVQKHRLE